MSGNDRAGSLAGRVAIVTGSSRGIGKQIALSLAREGAKVVICGRTEATRSEISGTIHDTAGEVEKLGGKALAIKCDVSKEEEVEAMVKEVVDAWGRVDVLVNNAGVSYWSPVVDTLVKSWDRVINVNLRGTFLCSKMVLPHMMRRKCGSIISISSYAAGTERKSRAGLAYAASKAAIERFSRGLAEEVRESNIAVNVLKPDKTVASEGMKIRAPVSEQVTWVSAENMCKAAVFLARQDAQGITGGIWWDEELVDRLGL